MAFPNKKADMPPPGLPKKKGLVIAVGIGKPKMPAPKMPGEDMDTPSASTEPGGANEPDPSKMEKAGVIRADHHCQQCENWEPDTGNCTVLGPGFAPDDACLRYFEEMDDEDEDSPEDPDASTEGAEGMPDGGSEPPPGMPA